MIMNDSAIDYGVVLRVANASINFEVTVAFIDVASAAIALVRLSSFDWLWSLSSNFDF
jgi:hypothetical protein